MSMCLSILRLLPTLLLWGCTRPPVPVPIAVSTVVPERLVPMRFSGSGLVLDAETRGWTYVHSKGWQPPSGARNCEPLSGSLIQLAVDER